MSNPSGDIRTLVMESTACRAATSILVVDSDARVRELLAHLLIDSGFTVVQAANGREAVQHIRKVPVDLVINGLARPEQEGVETLRQLRKEFPHVEVIAISGSQRGAFLRRAGMPGARASTKKHESESRQLQRAAAAVSGVKADEGETRLNRLPRQPANRSDAALAGLMLALNARERDASLHSMRVASYSVLLAWRMGMNSHDLEAIRQGALLHDIGKIGISDSVFRKPGRLTEQEWGEMKRHPEIGYRMLLSAGYAESVANLALSHHERFDGDGYPQGLSGDAIPLAARIVSLADALDAMTANRCYRRALSFAAARADIEKSAGRQFDPIVVRHFLGIPVEEWVATGRQPYSALSRLCSVLPGASHVNREAIQQ